MVTCGAPPDAPVAGVVGAAGAVGVVAVPVPAPPPVTLTGLKYQPLPGVCRYTFSVWLPAGTDEPGTTTVKPDDTQNGLPRAVATSGRSWATTPLASMWPPPSIVPSQ